MPHEDGPWNQSPTTRRPCSKRYEDLRDRGTRYGAQGRFGEAEPLLREALAIARQCGDADLEDLAFCNWAKVKIALAEGSEPRLPRPSGSARSQRQLGKLQARRVPHIPHLRVSRANGVRVTFLCTDPARSHRPDERSGSCMGRFRSQSDRQLPRCRFSVRGSARGVRAGDQSPHYRRQGIGFP